MGWSRAVKFTENFAEITAVGKSACRGGLFDGYIFTLQFQQSHIHAHFQQIRVNAFAAGFPEYPAEMAAAVTGKISQFIEGYFP